MPTGGLGGPAAPLFEEEGHVGLQAGVPDPRGPLLLHRAEVGAGLASGDPPVTARQVQPRGTRSASGCTVRPKPGPEVRGSPSFWYFADPMALSRFASVSA